jgi:hypothetical protein
MTRMFALTTTQGTAMAETAICSDHWAKTFKRIRSNAQFIEDWDRLNFVDCSGNELLECTVCGATADECTIDNCPCKQDD